MREQRRLLVGTVTSDKMNKTVVVAVQTAKRHPVYDKVIRSVKKYKAHDELNECSIGDEVQLIEARPLSRHKRWSVKTIIKRAK